MTEKNITHFDFFYDPLFIFNYKKAYFIEDGHLSPFGAKLVADKTYDLLLQEKVFDYLIDG